MLYEVITLREPVPETNSDLKLRLHSFVPEYSPQLSRHCVVQ